MLTREATYEDYGFQKMKIRDWVNFARILRCVTRYCCCSAQRGVSEHY